MNLHPCCFHAVVILAVLLFVTPQEPSQKTVTEFRGISKNLPNVFDAAFCERFVIKSKLVWRK